MLPHKQFEQLVAEAIDSLPDRFQRAIDNVEFVIESWPSSELLSEVGMPDGNTLLGLYEGIPLTERTHDYGMVTPDVITLFQGPIEDVAGQEPKAIRDQVRRTVLHELAHYFGIDDDRLIELDAY